MHGLQNLLINSVDQCSNMIRVSFLCRIVVAIWVLSKVRLSLHTTIWNNQSREMYYDFFKKIWFLTALLFIWWFIYWVLLSTLKKVLIIQYFLIAIFHAIFHIFENLTFSPVSLVVPTKVLIHGALMYTMAVVLTEKTFYMRPMIHKSWHEI